MTHLIHQYVEYNVWANEKSMAIFRPLETAILEKEIVNSFPSVQLTLLHIWNAQHVWYNRINAIPITTLPSQNLDLTMMEIFDGLQKHSEDFRDCVLSLEEDQFNLMCHYNDLSSNTPHTQSFGQIIQHCMNHSTYHRGQLTMMARQLQLTDIQSTDFIYYLRALKSV